MHDLNNLLNIIKVNLELLEREVSDEGLQSLIKDAHEAAVLCNKLTQSLLTERAGQISRPRPLEINDELAAIANLIDSILGPQIRVERDLDRDLGTAYADPVLFRNACLNLVVNAREAMPAGGTLSIATANVEVDTPAIPKPADATAGRFVMLTVRDTGAGIPPEVMRRVFEPYFTTKTGGGSLGLGLTLVREFCEQFDGFVRLESDLGKGTAVSIYLPRTDAR